MVKGMESQSKYQWAILILCILGAVHTLQITNLYSKIESLEIKISQPNVGTAQQAKIEQQ